MSLSVPMRLGVFVSALLLSTISHAQAPDLSWQRLDGPFGGVALGVASAGGVAVATDGEALYRSTDAATWTQISLSESAFTGIAATPDGAFWSTGADVLRSLDAGVTWTPAGAGLPADGARSIAGLSDGTAIAATSAGVFRLPAGATVWQPSPFTAPVSTVGVLPDGTVLAGLASTGIASEVYSVARSVDAGQTWQTVPIGPYRRAEIVGLVVLADGAVVVGGYPTSDTGRSASAYRSADGGITWTPVAGLPDVLVVSRMAGAGQTVTITGFGPDSYVSGDGGATWTTVPLRVNGLAAGPGADVLAATERRGVLHSSDALATVTDATEGFGRAAVSQVEVRGDLVVAAGLADFGYGTGLYRSPDRGATWSRVDLAFASRGLTDVHIDPAGRVFASPDRCFDAGCAPSGVYRSLDGGLTWAATPLALGGSVAAARLADGPGGALWALFSTRALYRSLDGGDSWTLRGTAPFSKTFAVGDDGTLWVGSDQPEVSVARSTDGGATWQTVLAPSAGLRTSAIVVARDGAVVVGASGLGYRSADNGQTWSTISFGFAQPFYELDVLRRGADGTLFAGADRGAPVLRSLDDGQSWAPVADGLPETEYAIDLALGADGVLWAALGRGGLFRTTAPAVVSADTEAPEEAFGVTVAPNPARGASAVTLALPVAEAALRVTVVDALGRAVARLHDGPASAGALRLALPPLPAGVYVVRAVADGQTASRRLVVVR